MYYRQVYHTIRDNTLSASTGRADQLISRDNTLLVIKFPKAIDKNFPRCIIISMKGKYFPANLSQLDERKVRHLLIDLNLSLGKLAERIEISFPTLSQHITGKRRNPRIQQAIADALGVPLEQILLLRGTP